MIVGDIVGDSKFTTGYCHWPVCAVVIRLGGEPVREAAFELEKIASDMRGKARCRACGELVFPPKEA